KQNNTKLFTSLKTFNNPYLNKLSEELLNLSNIIREYNKEQFYDKVLDLLKIHDYLESCENKEETYARITSLKQLISHSDLSIEHFINQLHLQDEEDNKSKFKVNLMTIHRSKGLEFKVVIIIGVNEGIIPTTNYTKGTLDEERRLLYVAITRAKEILYLSSSRTHIIYGKKKNLLPSTFLLESNISSQNTILKQRISYSK
ncbi:MAG: 3'-5' exonuclease, partial [Peptostreptococcaceae bacterium]